MSTLTVIIGITVPILTYLIGRYYKAVKQTNYDNLIKARDYWQTQHREAVEARKKAYESIGRFKDLAKANEAKIAELEEKQNNDFARAAYTQHLEEQLANAPKFQIVANTKKHPAANDNYLYIEGTINGTREAGLLRLKQWDDAKATLLKNPEDKPQ